jgi:hypothetical protein
MTDPNGLPPYQGEPSPPERSPYPAQSYPPPQHPSRPDQPYGQPPYPPPYGQSSGLPPLSYRPGPPTPPVPPDLDTVRTLWLVTAVLGVSSTLCTVVGLDRAALARQLYDRYNHSYPSGVKLTLGQAGAYVWVGLVLIVVFDLGFWALALTFVRRMRAGRLWARALLTVFAAFELVTGVDALFGVRGTHSALELAVGAMSILRAVLAAGAIYLMHRPESNSFFQQHQQHRQPFRR